MKLTHPDSNLPPTNWHLGIQLGMYRSDSPDWHIPVFLYFQGHANLSLAISVVEIKKITHDK